MSDDQLNNLMKEHNKKLDEMSLEDRYKYFLRYGTIPGPELSKILLDNGIIDEYTYNIYMQLNNREVGDDESSKKLHISIKSEKQLNSAKQVLDSIQKKLNGLDPEKDAVLIGKLHNILNDLNSCIASCFIEEIQINGGPQRLPKKQGKQS